MKLYVEEVGKGGDESIVLREIEAPSLAEGFAAVLEIGGVRYRLREVGGRLRLMVMARRLVLRPGSVGSLEIESEPFA